MKSYQALFILIALLVITPDTGDAQDVRALPPVRAENVTVPGTGQKLTLFGNFMVYMAPMDSQAIVESVTAKGSPGTRLAFGCDNGKLLFALFIPGKTLLGDDSKEIFVSWRTGETSAMKEDFWKLQGDEQGRARSVGQARALAEALRQGGDVTMIASETSGERIINATFSAHGFKEAIGAAKTCL